MCCFILFCLTLKKHTNSDLCYATVIVFIEYIHVSNPISPRFSRSVSNPWGIKHDGWGTFPAAISRATRGKMRWISGLFWHVEYEWAVGLHFMAVGIPGTRRTTEHFVKKPDIKKILLSLLKLKKLHPLQYNSTVK